MRTFHVIRCCFLGHNATSQPSWSSVSFPTNQNEPLLKCQQQRRTYPRNLALKQLRILRRNSNGKPVTDLEVRKLTRIDQTEIDIAAAQLEAEGMITITRLLPITATNLLSVGRTPFPCDRYCVSGKITNSWLRKGC